MSVLGMEQSGLRSRAEETALVHTCMYWRVKYSMVIKAFTV